VRATCSPGAYYFTPSTPKENEEEEEEEEEEREIGVISPVIRRKKDENKRGMMIGG
jgi:hypothetical protein